MFMWLLFQLLTAWFAFLLPSFYTFKALSSGGVSSSQLERWVKYWVVVGAFVAVEYVAGPFISWFPFYHEVKTLFFLYLSLPQTEGSTYVYNTHVYPFFVQNEAELEAGIVNLHLGVFHFAQARLTKLVEFVIDSFHKAANARQHSGETDAAGRQHQQPQQGGRFGASLDMVTNLWKTYGSSLLGGGAQQGRDVTATPAVGTSNQPGATHVPPSGQATN